MRRRHSAGADRSGGGQWHGVLHDAGSTAGDQGRLIAIDPLSVYVERLTEKVAAEGLRNVEVVKRDALETGLDAASIERVLLFGVLPFPTVPLNRLLPEMHRVPKAEGILAVWQFPIAGWVPASVRRSGLFAYLHKRNGVDSYRRCQGSIISGVPTE